jgi:hypothetical protein
MRILVLCIGAIALIWHAIAAADYILTLAKVPDYLALVSPEQLALFIDIPLWVHACWAVAVWAGLLAAMFLLTEDKSSVIWMAIAAAGAIGLAVYFAVLRGAELSQVAGWGGYAFVIGPAVAASVFYIFARQAKTHGYLS